LPKVLGYGIGYRFKEDQLAIKEDNNRVITENMVFNLKLSLANFDDKPERSCLLISDTLLISKDNAIVLTSRLPRSFNDISYQMDDIEEEEAD